MSDRKPSVYVIQFKLEADGAAIFFTICPVFALNWNANIDGSIFHGRPGAIEKEPHSTLPPHFHSLHTPFCRLGQDHLESPALWREGTQLTLLDSECSSSTGAL